MFEWCLESLQGVGGLVEGWSCRVSVEIDGPTGLPTLLLA